MSGHAGRAALALVTLLRMTSVDGGWGLRLRFSEPSVIQANGISGVAGRSPDRIVIGLTHTTLAAGARGVVTGQVFRARAQQLDASSAQITIELDVPLGFAIRAHGPETTITLVPDPDSGTTATPPTIPRVEVPPVR
jgi:hypothetical protein